MFRAKSKTLRVKRSTSPSQATESKTDISGSGPGPGPVSDSNNTDISGTGTVTVAPVVENNLKKEAPTMNGLTNFFEAESYAATNTRPWLRLERGIRLQKLRAFAESYPGLTAVEKDNLNKMLVKANDSKLLNTKQQIVYENGKILNIRGLKIIRDGDPTHSAAFKIEIHRQTKKRNND